MSPSTERRPRRRLPSVRLRETRPEPPLLSAPPCTPASVTVCEAEGNSTGASAAVASTMHPRTCLAHFVDLIKNQSIHQILRVTPKRGENKYGGHLVALGPDGFFLCTCRELLIKGLPCRHSILALLDTQIAFNGACVAPRW